MKRVIGLKSPAMDLLGDVKDCVDGVLLRNACMFTWTGDFMKVIPFDGCKDELLIPYDNVAWDYEAETKVANYHTKVVEKRKELGGCQLLTKDEHQELLAKKQAEVKSTLNKIK